MNKSELVDHIAESADISKTAASRALDSALDAISGSLRDGESVALVGFWSRWSVVGRVGRLPVALVGYRSRWSFVGRIGRLR